MAEYTSLKVPELKKLLAEKGLSQTGNKADLVARLAENDQKKAEEEAKQPEPEKKTDPKEQAKKRAERAKRFGIEEDDDNKKLSDRAKRFGLDDKEIPAGLDSALPERPLKRGRGRENDGKANGRANKRQSLDRRGGRRRGGRQGGNEGSSNAGAKPRSNILSDPAEKAKAEKRAARFASS
uniref:SAP domain-containing protein n=1 Tax=Bionectria ochroleuca TaxID=29856 RepID=A0A0B7JX86_BIOOC